jgi:DNA-binding transcriptional LysR family regulator
MAPTTLTLFYLGGVLGEFMHAHPKVTIELSLVDQSVNPLEEGFDIAISGRSASYEGVVDVPLCSAQPLLCASPAYLERRGTPAHPRELMGHDCLVFKPIGVHWIFRSEQGDVDIDVSARLIADDNFTLLQAARASCGIAIIPRYVAAEALSKGELLVVLPGYPPHENWFKAYVPRRRLELAPVKTLLEWLKKKMVDFPPTIAGVKHAPIALPRKKTAP